MTYGASPSDWSHFDLILGLGKDLLPVVSNPHATISADSRMKAVGKTPSRYNREREVVGFPQWTQFDALPHDLDTWSTEPDLGICVQTRHVRALDIDVDSDVAFDIEQAFLDVLGIELPVRCRSNSRKMLLAFITEGDLAKRRFATADGAVELLATGQQFVAVGTHTSGVPYNWSGGLPTHIPTITLDQLDAAWQAIVDRFAVEPTASGEYASRRRGADLAIEDAVADHLYARNLVLDEGRDGALYVDCPWKQEHTSDSGVTETAWYPAGTGGYERGHFKCLHAHCNDRTDSEFKRAVLFDETGFEPVTDEPGHAPSRRQFQAVPCSQFAGGQPLDWFIKGVMPRAGLGVIYGASGAGKSFLALDVLSHIALGDPWRNHRVKPGRVVYVAAEGVGGLRRRLQALAKHKNFPLETLDENILIIPEAPNLTGDGDADALVRELCRVEADLVVVDTLAQAMAGGDENSTQDMGLLVARCRRIHEATGAMVLLIHHSGKDASKGARGSTVLLGACDFEAEVSRDGGRRQVKLTKMKDGEDGATYQFRLDVKVLDIDEDGDEITSCAVIYEDTPAQSVQPPPTGKWQSIVWRIASDLFGESGVPIAVSSLIDVAAESIPQHKDTKGRSRNRDNAKRAIEELCATRRFLHVDGGISVEW